MLFESLDLPRAFHAECILFSYFLVFLSCICFCPPFSVLWRSFGSPLVPLDNFGWILGSFLDPFGHRFGILSVSLFLPSFGHSDFHFSWIHSIRHWRSKKAKKKDKPSSSSFSLADLSAEYFTFLDQHSIHQEGPLYFRAVDLLMVTLQSQELCFLKDEARQDILSLDLVPDDAKGQGRQAGICLRVILEVEEPPSLDAIVMRDTLDDLQGSTSRICNQPVIHIRGKLVLCWIVVRDVADRLFAVVEGFHEICEVHIALTDCIQELPSPFFPAGALIIER